MKKISKKQIFITLGICLLPALFGILLYEQFPENIPVHWDMYGEVTRTASRFWGVFGLPLVLFVIQSITLFAINYDPKKKNQSRKMRVLSIWINPVVSLVLVPSLYLVVLGEEISIPFVVSIFIGILFLIFGNYLAKTRQNYTIGIKLPWTLNNRDNWNKTHRFSGKLFMGNGVLLIMSSLFLLPRNMVFHAWITLGSVAFIVCIPIIYSYRLYKKEEN